MQNYFEWEALLHGDCIRIIENRVAQKVEIAAGIICSKVIQDRRVADQNVQLAGPDPRGEKWIIERQERITRISNTATVPVLLPGCSLDSSGCDSTTACFPSLYSLLMPNCEPLLSSGT